MLAVLEIRELKRERDDVSPTPSRAMFRCPAAKRVLNMRVLALVALSAVALAAARSAGADPAQTQPAQSTAPVTASTTAATGSPTTPRPAAAAQETVTITAPRTVDNLDQVVCKTSPPETGSRIGGSRECHTERQWKVRQQQAQDMLAHTQNLGMQQPLR
jgi:hypothetical protein